MSGKNTPDVRGLLLEGNFGASRELQPSDPITTTQMVLEIDRIRPYDRNPRRELNPRYDDIKDSIRAQGGLNNPLTVTRRPGDDLFMVESGGNTRLMILKELWQETRLESFHRIHCLFVPWKSESHVLSAHLIENELRGDMLFIDKAVALKDLQAQLERESGCALSRSEFQRRLGAIGYQISRRQMIRYDYAVETLEPLVPKALRAGLGRHQIDRLRDIENAYRTLHRSLSETASDPLPAFDPWFADVLAVLDGESLALTTVRRELDRRLADISGRPLNRIRIEVDALLHEKASGGDEETEDAESSASPESDVTDGVRHEPPSKVDDVSAVDLSGTGNGKPRRKNHARGAADATPSGDAATSDQSCSATSPGPLSSGSRSESSPKSATGPKPDPFLDEALAADPRRLPKETDLKSLRSRAYVLATRIAQGLGFQDAVRPWQSGFGFVLDLPEGALRDDHSWHGWWLLFGLSEQSASEERLALAPKDLRLPAMLLEGQEQAFYAIVDKPPNVSLLPFHLLLSRQLSDRVFHDFLLLMEGCRTLRRNFRESDLWECITVEQVRMRAQLAELERNDDG